MLKKFLPVVATAILLGTVGLASAGSHAETVAPAGDTMSVLTNNGAGYHLKDSLLGEDFPIDFGGWTQFGYTSRSTGLFNSAPHAVRNHQTWLYVEKAADGSNGFDWGFRFDAMYGTDADDTQAFGNNPGKWDFDNGFDHGVDGFAFPQLYLTAAYKDFTLTAGHFYTLVGYEVVTAPDNFFMSHAFTMYNSEPFTHTGALVTYEGIENLTIYAGWTAGWDTGFDQVGDGSSFLGGFSYSPIDELAVTYIATGGDLGAIGDGYTHSIVVDVTPIENLNYVLQSDLVEIDNYDTIGINQYLTYWLMDEVGVGVRYEWWKADGVSYYEATGGINLKPIPNLTLRPEVRWQWSPAGENGNNPAGLPVGEGAIFGMDIILTF